MTGMRRVRRVADGYLRRPFMPYGFWPAALLGLLAFTCITLWASRIERQTEAAARVALSEAGFTWAEPVANGQWIDIKGKPPSEAEGQRALEVVRTKKWKTIFFGNMAVPARRVRAQFGDALTVTAPPAAAATVPLATPVSNDWRFKLSNGVLRLEGQVPDETTRNAIVSSANAARASQGYTVENALTVSGTAAPEGYLSVALRGVNTLSRCDRGETSFLTQRFNIYCELPQAAEAGVRSEVNASLPLGSLGAVNILPAEAIVSCEAALSAILTEARINFGSGSAVIPSGSAILLNRVFDAAENCPGTLRIEGHTDNEGSAALNDQLSQRRAEAVRRELIRRGLPESRLVAEGFGARKPIAENTTEAGKARNRRIEIRVVRNPG